jgi:hypothetical protein
LLQLLPIAAYRSSERLRAYVQFPISDKHGKVSVADINRHVDAAKAILDAAADTFASMSTLDGEPRMEFTTCLSNVATTVLDTLCCSDLSNALCRGSESCVADMDLLPAKYSMVPSEQFGDHCIATMSQRSANEDL